MQTATAQWEPHHTPDLGDEPRAELGAFLQAVIDSSAGRAISTAEFRHRALEAGFGAWAVESGVYRTLLRLHRHGVVERVESRGRTVYWARPSAASEHARRHVEGCTDEQGRL
ncbi:hypothetical protein ACNUDN_29565 [Mycobacterium sp. smrl_JER01]|jgi:Fe2+ or Zn2+ uptake regulation protein|uniref:Uncharacterized protein n=1 Tax=Mycolicibacterium gilvum (strain PYR-GCK) TaxID=350054 RepID=A4TFS6_MYCGI